MKPKILLASFIAILCAYHAEGQSRALFENELVNESPYRERMIKERSRKETKKVQLMRASLGSIKEKTDISINLFDSATYTPRGNWSYVNENGYEVWAGVEDGETGNYALFVQKDGRITGEMAVGGRSFQVENLAGDVHLLREIDVRKIKDTCLTEPYIPDSVRVNAGKGTTGGRTQATAATSDFDQNSTPFPVCSDDGLYESFLPNATTNTFRVGFTYTQDFETYFGNSSATMDFLNLLIEQVNYTYANSLIDVRAVLAFAYKTPFDESGTFNAVYDDFIIAQDPEFDPEGRYDEVFIYRGKYRADVCVLLINVGDETGTGRAHSEKKMAVVSRPTAEVRMTVAHEIGHLFNLEHNREEMNAVQKAFLDGKKAYGYLKTGLGENFRTVMSYGEPVARLPFYSDKDMYYNSHLRGNYYAEAADYMRSHLAEVVEYYNSEVNEVFSGNLSSGHIANIYGINTLEVSNSILEPSTIVTAHASQTVTMKPGFHAKNGSQFHAYVASLDTPPPPNVLPFVPGQPAEIKFIQGNYPFMCRGDMVDFCVDEVDNATHYTWSASSSDIGITTSFGGRAARVIIGPGASWTGTHSVSVRASNIYGNSSPKTITFGLNQYECGGGGPDPQAKVLTTVVGDSLAPATLPVLKVYPNPVEHSFTISYLLTKESYVKIYLIDLSGKIVGIIKDLDGQQSGSHMLTYDVAGKAAGLYIVQIRHNSGVTRQKILIK